MDGGYVVKRFTWDETLGKPIPVATNQAIIP